MVVFIAALPFGIRRRTQGAGCTGPSASREPHASQDSWQFDAGELIVDDDENDWKLGIDRINWLQ